MSGCKCCYAKYACSDADTEKAYYCSNYNRYHFKNVKTAEEVIAERKEDLLLNPPKSPLGKIIEREMKIMIETYKKAIETFGEESQIDMAIEEMSELTKALLKYRRAIKSGNDAKLRKIVAKHDISEEMADVSIMLAQLCLIFDNKESVDTEIEYKTKRLAERIEEYAK